MFSQRRPVTFRRLHSGGYGAATLKEPQERYTSRGAIGRQTVTTGIKEFYSSDQAMASASILHTYAESEACPDSGRLCDIDSPNPFGAEAGRSASLAAAGSGSRRGGKTSAARDGNGDEKRSLMQSHSSGSYSGFKGFLS